MIHESIGRSKTYKHERHNGVVGELNGQAGLFLQPEQDTD